MNTLAATGAGAGDAFAASSGTGAFPAAVAGEDDTWTELPERVPGESAPIDLFAAFLGSAAADVMRSGPRPTLSPEMSTEAGATEHTGDPAQPPIPSCPGGPPVAFTTASPNSESALAAPMPEVFAPQSTNAQGATTAPPVGPRAQNDFAPIPQTPEVIRDQGTHSAANVHAQTEAPSNASSEAPFEAPSKAHDVARRDAEPTREAVSPRETQRPAHSSFERSFDGAGDARTGEHHTGGSHVGSRRDDAQSHTSEESSSTEETEEASRPAETHLVREGSNKSADTNESRSFSLSRSPLRPDAAAETQATHPTHPTMSNASTAHASLVQPSSEPALAEGGPRPQPAEQLSWTPEVRHELAAKARQFMQNGETEIRITLDPPTLGKLSVRLEIGPGRVSAHIVATHAHAAELLERDREDLVRAFEAQGIDDVQVHVGSEKSFRDERRPAERFDRVPFDDAEMLEPRPPDRPPPARSARRSALDLVA